jgi:CheY-like chemotaxis protein/HPt (histidine-containing phosphotransfer) domain-containing protein
LLAEDNDTNRELIGAVLKQTGHDVVSVSNGAEACEAAIHDRWDVILMDVQMPAMDGYAAVRAIRDARGDHGRIPIIALTANALADEAERCREAGMDFHVPKPVDWPRLFSAMDRLVEEFGHGSGSNVSDGRGVVHSTRDASILETTVIDELRALIGQQNLNGLLRMFELEAGQRFAQQPGDADDVAAISAEVHGFAGGAGMLGFVELMEACRALNAALLIGSGVPAALEACRAARDRALAEIEKLKSAAAVASRAVG